MLVFKKHEIGFHFRCVRVCVCVCAYAQLFSLVRPFPPSWTIAPQAPLSMGFSRQEYWSASPFPTPRHSPNSVTLSQTFVGRVREDELKQTLTICFTLPSVLLMLTIYLIYEVTDVQRN